MVAIVKVDVFCHVMKQVKVLALYFFLFCRNFNYGTLTLKNYKIYWSRKFTEQLPRCNLLYPLMQPANVSHIHIHLIHGSKPIVSFSSQPILQQLNLIKSSFHLTKLQILSIGTSRELEKLTSIKSLRIKHH